jgi:uncharacterized membrane protein YvbJ
MNYCSNCGAQKEISATICPYCGYSFNLIEKEKEKDLKIQELEQKIVTLENKDISNPWSSNSSQFKYFWIMAIIMIVFFFAFIFFFVYMAST